MPSRRIVISGCSGGGKSTIIDGLASKGFITFPEAGRIIVREELESDGRAVPWVDRKLFVERLAILAITQFSLAANLDGLIFFDRSVIEAFVYSRVNGVELSLSTRQAALACQYDGRVFMVPPWEEMFTEDQERRHSFAEAVAEYDELYQEFEKFGYDICVIPQLPVDTRIEFILRAINA